MSKPTRAFFSLALMLVAASCGGDANITPYETFEEACAAVPGCGESRYPIVGALEPIFRVLVVRSPEGVFSIAYSERIKLIEGDGIPMGPPAGDVVLAGRDADGEVVDGQLIRFPTTRLVEGRGEDPLSVEESLEGEATSMIGYVRALPGVTELALLDLEGNVVTQAELPPAPVEVPGVGAQALIATSSSACAHIVLLDGEEDRSYFPIESPLVRPSPIHRALIDATLGRMRPILCHGISRIVLVDLPGEGARGMVAAFAGDVIQLNVGYLRNNNRFFDETELTKSLVNQIEWQRIFAHESGHVLDNLLAPAGSTIAVRVAARSLASQTLERVRIPDGLRASWGSMHDRFIAAGMAEVHEKTEARRAYTPDKIARAGSMSKYGSTKNSDDIAEMVAWLLMGPVYDAQAANLPADERQDLGCSVMRGYTEGGVPSRYAALYTKLRFLQDLGAFSADDIKWCTGPSLGLEELTTRGFTFNPGTSGESQFTEEATSELDESTYVFRANGRVTFDDERYPAVAQLRLAPTAGPQGEIALPRGIYAIDSFTTEEFRVSVEDRPAASFFVSDGFALIVSATKDQIVGSIFITEGFRYGAPIPVPQVFDPPLIISFSDDRPPR